MSVIALAGDWHGNRQWAGGRIQGIGERGIETILHLGDFGVWPGPSGNAFLQSVDKACERAGVDQVLVTPGNHDDWGRLTQMWSLPKYRDPETGDPLPLHLTDHITVLPRGHVWEIDDRRFLSLGGAPSVDRKWRTPGRDWWPEEAITEEDVERASRNGSPERGQIDVMITHDSPERPWMVPEVEAIVHGDAAEFAWPPDALADAAVGRQRLSRVVEAIRPRLLVHGHYHVSGEAVHIPGADHETSVWALNKDNFASNIRYLELATLSDPEWAR